MKNDKRLVDAKISRIVKEHSNKNTFELFGKLRGVGGNAFRKQMHRVYAIAKKNLTKN
jgi:hypothetical protein